MQGDFWQVFDPFETKCPIQWMLYATNSGPFTADSCMRLHSMQALGQITQIVKQKT